MKTPEDETVGGDEPVPSHDGKASGLDATANVATPLASPAAASSRDTVWEPPLAIAQPADQWSDWLWRRGGVVWLTATACLLAAALIVWAESAPSGRRLTVRFRQGHGIAAGDLVKYRGIEVGRVRKVDLAESMLGVDVHIVLHDGAEYLARAGGRYWIERPRLGLSRVSGLDTVVGPRYINAQPGPASAELVHLLEGVEAPQTLFGIAPEVVVIRFRQGFGLQQGDPVRLRGISVGEVISVQLDATGDAVEAHLQLLSEYSDLAREGTQFWVEHPQVGFQGVRGLDTLVGGRYIAVAPGPLKSEPRNQFEGLAEAPVTDLDPAGLLVTLKGDERFGLQSGARSPFEACESAES